MYLPRVTVIFLFNKIFVFYLYLYFTKHFLEFGNWAGPVVEEWFHVTNYSLLPLKNSKYDFLGQ